MNNNTMPRGCGRKPQQGGAVGENFGVGDAVTLATVYSPIQEWRDIYGNAEALNQGTVFGELDKQFSGDGKNSCSGRCGQ